MRGTCKTLFKAISGAGNDTSRMSPKHIFATLGVVCAVASFFIGGVPLLTGGVVFIGIACFF